MGLFRRNENVYEKNTQIAALEEDIKTLSDKLAKAKERLSDERQANMSLRSELEATETDNNNMRERNSQLLNQNKALLSEIEAIKLSKSGSKADYEAMQQADALKRNALTKYALELKRLKLFSAKWQSYFVDKPEIEKQELVNLLKDILSGSDTVQFILDAKEKTERVIEKVGEPFDAKAKIAEHFDESEEFNLDEAINPSEELDLEQLCKELGVFKG